MLGTGRARTRRVTWAAGGIIALISLLVFALARPQASALADTTIIDYSSGFSSMSGLQANANVSAPNTLYTPSVVNNTLQLTDGNPGEGTSVFSTTQVDLTQPFHVQFQATIVGGAPYIADGFTFVVQNDSRGTTALSCGGGDLGIGNADGNASVCNKTPISPSVAMEFDTFQNGWDTACGVPDINVIQNGNVAAPIGSPSCVNPSTSIASGTIYAWVDYDGSGKMSFYENSSNSKPSSPTLTYGVTLSSAVGQTGYMGFTAGTGQGVSTQQIHNWSVTSLAPAAPTITSPANGTYTNTSSLSISGTALPYSTVTVYARANSPSTTPCSTSIGTTSTGPTGSWNLSVGSPASDGQYLYEATASDAAGASPCSSPDALTVDRTAPAAPTISGPSGVTTNTSPAFGFTSSDNITSSSNLQFAYALDGPNGVTGTYNSFAPITGATFGPLTSGNYTLRVKAQDQAGNPSNESTQSFTVDANPPAAPVVNGGSTWGGTVANPFTLSGTAAAGSTVAVYANGSCSGTSPLVTVTAGPGGTWSTPISGITAEGTYRYSATASDGIVTSACSGAGSAQVDRSAATATVSFPALGTSTQYLNSAAWNSGCASAGFPGVVGICGTAADPGGSGVAGVFVAIENAQGLFWNGTSFTSNGAWLKATIAPLPGGSANWSLATPLPAPDGIFTVAAAAIDSAGNTPPIFSQSVYSLCSGGPSGGTLPLNGGTLAINGGICTVSGINTATSLPTSGTLAINGGSLAINGGTLPLNGGSLALNGGTLPLNGGSCAVNDNSGHSGTLAINGGTLVSSGGTLGLNGGSLALNGGTLGLNGGTYSVSGGTLPLNGGTLPLNGGNCTVTDASSHSGTLGLNGGNLTGTNGGTLGLNGGTLAINGGTLPLNGGTLGLNGGTLAINGGAGGNAGNVVVDTAPPTVSTFEIGGVTASGSRNLDPRSTLHIDFDNSIRSGTLGTGISVTAGSGPASGVSSSCDAGTCSIASISGFQPNTLYTVTVNGIQDLAGNTIATPASFQFTTAAVSASTCSATSDTDGDGVPDCFDGTATPTFTWNSLTTTTAAWGFRPNHQDLCLVESYMSGTAANGATYNQVISQAANQALVQAFANAPVLNVDGTRGIHLVIFEGDAAHSAGLPAGYAGPYFGGQIPMTDPLGDASTGSFNWSAVAPGTSQSYDSIANTNFLPTGTEQVCHYAVIAHNLGGTGSSGASRGIGAGEFVIALGGTVRGLGVGTQAEQQGTIMHELGHNLGLHHGGGPGIADLDLNYKPNYPSVMNYSYQFNGVPGGNAPMGLDYSRGTLAPLNENALVDSVGLGSAASLGGGIVLGTQYFCPGTTTNPNLVADATQPINWGCRTTGPLGTGVSESADINGDGVLGTLNDYNDWAHLTFNGGDIGLGAVPPPPQRTTIDITSGTGGGGANSVVQIEQNATPVYTFAGFFAPLDPNSDGTVWNTGHAGRTFPIKFQLTDKTGNQVTSLKAVTSINVTSTACSSGQTDPIAYDTTATSGLTYTGGQYQYNWKTPSTPGCYVVTFTFLDHSSRKAAFNLS